MLNQAWLGKAQAIRRSSSWMTFLRAIVLKNALRLQYPRFGASSPRRSTQSQPSLRLLTLRLRTTVVRMGTMYGAQTSLLKLAELTNELSSLDGSFRVQIDIMHMEEMTK